MFAFTIRQVEVFLEVCRAGSFQGAADSLRISQPAVSKQMAALEAQLGFSLFQRQPGGAVTLAPDGGIFRERAERFIEAGRALSEKRLTSRRSNRPLRLFVGGHLLDDYVRPRLSVFQQLHPEVTLEFLPETARYKVRAQITRGIVDAALLMTRQGDDLPQTRSAGKVPAGLFGRADRYPPDMTPEHISRAPFILPPQGSKADVSEREWLAASGIVPSNVAARAQHHDVRIKMAVEGIGITYAFLSMARRHDPDETLRLLKHINDWEQRLFIHPDVPPQVAADLADFLCEAIREDRRR